MERIYELDYERKHDRFFHWAIISLIANGTPHGDVPLDLEQRDRVRVELKINGVDADPKVIIKSLEEQLDRMVNERAREIIEERRLEAEDAIRDAARRLRALFPVAGDDDEEGD